MKSPMTKENTSCDLLLIGYEDEENLGLRYIHSYLLEKGVKAAFTPFNLKEKHALKSLILKKKPLIIGFSLIFQRMVYDFAEMVAFLREEGVKSTIVMGGHFPTLEYQKLFEVTPGLDAIIRHEGEETLYDFYQAVHEKKDWSEVSGIVFQKDKQLLKTPSRPLIKDLDILPFPLRSSVPSTHRGIGLSSMIASRGCYYDCTFCSIRTFYDEPEGSLRRTRSAANVASEMEALYHQLGTKIFIFKDDDLSTRSKANRKWIDDFITELRERELHDKILWRISTRVDDIDRETFSKLKEVGLSVLYVGIESGNESGLKIFNKGYKVEDVFKASKTLKEVGINMQCGFMLFDPDSTLDTIKENIRFLKKLGSDGSLIVNFTKMFPYAGAPVTKRLAEEGRLIGDFSSPDYHFQDGKVDLFQRFSTVLHKRNFQKNGIANVLQASLLDALIVEKFYSDQYDSSKYMQGITDIASMANLSMLNMLEKGVEFMEKRTEEEILRDWEYLNALGRVETTLEMEYQELLVHHVSQYDFYDE